ncbi:MAG TPA: cation:proton antiporter [Microvirga sp.]|jgi:CPA2 family monovalent cation:H+ antiporter-2|nr:cation:proton antiporter [Microvirga sp.]
MAVAPSPEVYKELILFLGTAGVVVPLFHRLRISPVLGFLGAGALLGPYGLGRFVPDVPWLNWFTIASREETTHLAEFGVVFLLFTIGIELSWERLRILRRLVFGLGSLQVALCAVVIAALIYPFAQSRTAAAFTGLAVALSSTAIVVPVLAAQKRLNAPPGRASFAVLLFQDLAVAPILFTIAVLGAGEQSNMLSAFFWALAQAALAVTVIVIGGRLLLRPLFQLVAATRSAELFMAACLLVVVGTGLVAAVSGLSMALGAFVAGLLLAETEYRRAIETTIDPFKGLLLGVFFVTVGMGLDLSRLLDNPITIAVAAIGLVAVKAAIVFLLGRAFGLTSPVAAETALLLGPGGEFAFVIIGGATVAGLVPYGIGQDLLLVTTLTMIAIPVLARLARGAGARLERQQPVDATTAIPPSGEETGHVIVAGYGRVGQLVSEMLARHKLPYLAIDMDPVRVAAERRAGRPVYFGDSTDANFLRACGIERARALVVTLDTPSAVEAVVSAARAERPDLTVVARARDARHATQLYDLGVDDAVPETIEASLQLSEAVLADVGVPMGLVIASIHERRDEFRSVLKRKDTTRDPARTEFRARRTLGKRAS